MVGISAPAGAYRRKEKRSTDSKDTSNFFKGKDTRKGQDKAQLKGSTELTELQTSKNQPVLTPGNCSING